MNMTIMALSQFLIRFILFWVKILLSCVFVMFLQVQIGHKTLEEWLEQGLKHSSLSRHLHETTVAGQEKVYEKFPHLKGLTQNKIVLNNAVLELHSGLLDQMKQSMDEFDALALEQDQRLPAAAPSQPAPKEPGDIN